MKNHMRKWQTSEKITISGFICALFVLAFYRSVMLDYTNDEAYSFLNVDTINFKQMYGTANTHWLNTICMFVENLFGNSEWILRIHSSIAILFFSYYVIRLFTHQFNNYLVLIPVTLLLCNHYLFDFFSLSRGYALALMFEVMAFYQIAHHKSDRFYIYLLLSLATLSNYTCIYILFAYFFFDVLKITFETKGKILLDFSFYKTRLPVLLLSLFAIPNIYYIKYVTGDLEEGSTIGYVSDTLKIFYQRTFYHIPPIVIFYVLVVWSLLLVAFYLVYHKQMKSGFRMLFNMYFFCIILIYVLFYTLHVPFPYGRTAFFMVILFLVVSSYAILFIIRNLPKGIQAIACVLFFGLNMAYALAYRNYNATLEWWMQQGLKEFCIDMTKHYPKNKNAKMGMSIDHYGSFNNYYRYKGRYNLPDSIFVYSRAKYEAMPPEISNQFRQQDYLLLVNNWKDFIEEKVGAENYTEEFVYPDMKSTLLKIKSPQP